jgi:hypothetical protein
MRRRVGRAGVVHRNEPLVFLIFAAPFASLYELVANPSSAEHCNERVWLVGL